MTTRKTARTSAAAKPAAIQLLDDILAKDKATAKAAPKGKAKDADTITTVQTVNRGRVSENKDPTVIAATEAGPSVTINVSKLTKQINDLMVVGGSLAALQAAIAKSPAPTPKLARGVEAIEAPHSAKSVQDAKAKTTPTPTKTAPKTKPNGKDFTYAVTGNVNGVKPGTFRLYMLTTIMAHTNTTDAKAAHAKSGQFQHERLHFSWARDNGYISY